MKVIDAAFKAMKSRDPITLKGATAQGETTKTGLVMSVTIAYPGYFHITLWNRQEGSTSFLNVDGDAIHKGGSNV